MKQLNFKYAAASNFMCFGPQGVEFDFEKMGSIVHVTGRHVNPANEMLKQSNNGCGKSSVPDLLSYALTGKTVKPNLSHNDVINNKEKKKLSVEVRLDEYRIVRTRKPDSLRIWKSEAGLWTDETEETRGGMPATQAYINEIIGLSHATLSNLIFFTDDNRTCFLECNAADKRHIVENMLGLERYREYHENAKQRKKLLAQKVKSLTREYEFAVQTHKAAEAHLAKSAEQEAMWRQKIAGDLRGLVASVTAHRDQLKKSDAGAALAAYQDAQVQLATLATDLQDREGKQAKVVEAIKAAKDKLDSAREVRQKHRDAASAVQLDVNAANKQIAAGKVTVADLTERKKATQCPWCLQGVKKESFHSVVTKCENEVGAATAKLAALAPQLKTAQDEVQKYTAYAEKLSAAIAAGEETQRDVVNDINTIRRRAAALGQIKEPKVGQQELALEQKIEALTKQAVEKKAEYEGDSPFVTVIASDKVEIAARHAEADAKRAAVGHAEAELPYYEYYLKAFGDNGIRKFVVRGVLPALNNRMAYWLQYLMDNKIVIKFNDELEETITRNPGDGDPFVYHALSKGQQRRLNLAVQQAFAYVMMVTNGTSPSFVFLDEVSSNIDAVGVHAVWQMISELAKDKQVFVTTHSPELQQLLDGCDTIDLEMTDGVTTVAKK